MYSREERPLNDKETRLLHVGIAAARKEIAVIRRRAPLACALTIGILWGLTLLATRAASILTPTLFWVLVGIPTSIWVWAGLVRPHRKNIARSEDALTNGRADETRISTDAVVEFAEIEDEGACYAFQAEQDRIVFVCGQDFYSGRSFPSTDFSIVSILGRNGGIVQVLIEKRGERLHPIRTISAEVKKQLRIPEHLEVVSGKLESLEGILGGTHPPA